MKNPLSNPFLRFASFQNLEGLRSPLGLSLVFCAVALQSAFSANVWDGGGATGVWSDLGNWDSNTTPVSPTALQFGGVLQLNSNNDLFPAATIFNGITFNAGAGAFALSGNSINIGGNIVNSSSSNQTINLDLAMTGARNFTTNASGNLTLGGVVSGGFNFVKGGFGTLTINGSSASTFSAQTQVSGGTLMLDFANMATPTNLIASTNTLQTGGGELYIKGKSTGTTSQTLGNLTQGNTSFSKVTLESNGGSGTTLTLGTVSHTAGNVTLFDISTSGSGVTTTTGSANTVISAGFIVKDSGGTGFAVKNGSNTNFVRYDDATSATALASGATVSTTNYSTLNSAASVTLNAGALSLNTLAVDTTNGTRSIDLGTGIKTLSNIGILFRGSNNATISNGQIGANNAETIIHQLGSGKLTISGTVGSGTASLTKSGSGEVELSGNNTYTGATRVLDGTLTVTNTLGATAITVGGTTGTQGTAAVVNLNTGSSIAAGSITLNNVNAVVNQTQANAISNTTTFTNTAGTLNLNADNSTAWNTVTAFSSSNSTFTLGIGNDNALGARTLSLSGNTNIRSNGGAHTISATLTLDQSTVTGSNDLTFSGLATWQNTTTFTVNNSGLTTFSGGLNLRSGTTAQRTMTVAGTGNINFGSVIANGSSLNGIMDFKGSGTHTLGAANTYSGTTTIGGVVNGSSTAPTVKLGNGAGLGFGGASAVIGSTTVNTGATLDLNGQTGIQEPITINGTGVGNNGALINSNTTTEAVVENGFAAIGIGAVGSGYADGSYAVNFTGGGGTGAAATATVVGGAVVSVQVTTAGSGYTSNPTGSITGAGTGATFTTSASSVALGSASSIGGPGNIRINAPVTGGSALSKVGAGTLTLTAPNTYTGTTTISGGKLTLIGAGSIASSPQIIVGASTTLDVSGVTGSYTLGAAQTLSGTGTVVGAASIAGTLSPGNSPGMMSTGSQTWLDGGDYNWQIANAAGATGVGYDTLSLTGSLDLSNLSAAGFSINLWSLSSTGPDVNGNAANFNNTTSYSWTLLSTTSGITGFDAADFAIHTGAFNGTGGFSNAPGDGVFSLAQSGNDLVLNFSVVPEPSTALIGGLAALTLLRRRRLV